MYGFTVRFVFISGGVCFFICLAEDSYEILSLIFSEKQRKSIYKCRLLQSTMTGALRINNSLLCIMKGNIISGQHVSN